MKQLKEISEKPLTTHSAAREDIYDLRVELNHIIRALNQLALEVDKTKEIEVQGILSLCEVSIQDQKRG